MKKAYVEKNQEKISTSNLKIDRDILGMYNSETGFKSVLVKSIKKDKKYCFRTFFQMCNDIQFDEYAVDSMEDIEWMLDKNVRLSLYSFTDWKELLNWLNENPDQD